MCDKCADIDYPIGDVIWLPCGGPKERYQNQAYRHKPTRRPDESKDWEILASLFRGMARHAPHRPTEDFEGVE